MKVVTNPFTGEVIVDNHAKHEQSSHGGGGKSMAGVFGGKKETIGIKMGKGQAEGAAKALQKAGFTAKAKGDQVLLRTSEMNKANDVLGKAGFPKISEQTIVRSSKPKKTSKPKKSVKQSDLPPWERREPDGR